MLYFALRAFGFRITFLFKHKIAIPKKKRLFLSPTPFLPCSFPPLCFYNAVSVDLGPLPFSLLLPSSAVHILCPTTNYFFLVPFAPFSITSFSFTAIFSFCSSNLAFSSLPLYSSTPCSSHIFYCHLLLLPFSSSFSSFFHGSFLIYLFLAGDGPSRLFLLF
jgi:hypothetical protein